MVEDLGVGEFGGVTVAPHLSPAQAAKTLAHELGHVIMHSGAENFSACRGQAEIEAESVAYILCSAAGLHSGAYSFGYVAHWAASDPKAIRHSAERVITTARALLEAAGLSQPHEAATPETRAA